MVSKSNQLIEYSKQLPDAIEELIDFVIVGSEAIKSFKAKLRACEKAEIVKEAKDQALLDGRKVSRLVLEAEDKLGAILENDPNLHNYQSSGRGTLKQPSLPNGINKKESHIAQEIHRNPDLVEQVWIEKINDIPTRHDVLKAIKHKKRKDKIEKQKEELKNGINKPNGKYDIIVIDPPWEYEGEYDADNRRGTVPYPTMTVEELKQIQLPSEDNCILWLWTTHKWIWSAKELLNHWGFEYKAILIWDKEKIGIGRWLRLQCEFCLLGIKGKPVWDVKNLRDILREPRKRHSQKPISFYEMIDKNFVGKKLDYFYGDKREGWDVVGTGEV